MKQLAKYHMHCALEWVATEWRFNNVAPGYNDGWRLFDNTNRNAVATLSETYFDLAGLAMDEKTIMTDAMTTQEAYLPTISAGQAGDQVWVFDIMTSVPFKSDLDWARVYLSGAGFPSGPLNFEHVLYQRVRRYTLDLDTAAAFPLLADDIQSGSLAPTASDRIYSYRLMVYYNLSGAGIGVSVPISRHLIQCDVKEEPQYEYMMRLKRSYDLQQEPDVD